jgi:rubrerythrin
MSDIVKRREEKEKQQVIDLLRKQINVESELVRLYGETIKDIKSSAVVHMLHMIDLDSRRHIDICQSVIEVLQGEEVLKPEREELAEGLQRHIALEKVSIERAKSILDNVWIKETKGLKDLIEKLKKDEENHHRMLKQLAEQHFFREDPNDFYGMFRDPEERYIKFERKKTTQ